MLKPQLISAIVIAILCVVVAQVKAEDDQSGLTASDIAQALGMNWWIVRFPTDMRESDSVGLAYRHSDGTIETSDSVAGHKVAGTTAKVIVWESEDGNNLRYTILGEAISMKANLRKKEAMKGGSRLVLSQGKTVDAGTVLMKFGRSTIGSHDVRPGEIGLILHVENED